MRALPITGGITTPMRRNIVVLWNLLASQPVPMIVKKAITDAGRLISVDWRLVNPNPLITRLPKLPVPPFGIS
jgi:hypothetical protein